jgi:hypothetical protein
LGYYYFIVCFSTLSTKSNHVYHRLKGGQESLYKYMYNELTCENPGFGKVSGHLNTLGWDTKQSGVRIVVISEKPYPLGYPKAPWILNVISTQHTIYLRSYKVKPAYVVTSIKKSPFFLSCHRKCHMNWTSFKRPPVL